MRRAGIRQARQNLSQLVEAVQRGEEIVLTDRGRAVAELVPLRADKHAPWRSRKRQRAALRFTGPSTTKVIGRDRDDRF